jgi:hypothetical protein
LDDDMSVRKPKDRAPWEPVDTGALDEVAANAERKASPRARPRRAGTGQRAPATGGRVSAEPATARSATEDGPPELVWLEDDSTGLEEFAPVSKPAAAEPNRPAAETKADDNTPLLVDLPLAEPVVIAEWARPELGRDASRYDWVKRASRAAIICAVVAAAVDRLQVFEPPATPHAASVADAVATGPLPSTDLLAYAAAPAGAEPARPYDLEDALAAIPDTPADLPPVVLPTRQAGNPATPTAPAPSRTAAAAPRTVAAPSAPTPAVDRRSGALATASASPAPARPLEPPPVNTRAGATSRPAPSSATAAATPTPPPAAPANAVAPAPTAPALAMSRSSGAEAPSPTIVSEPALAPLPPAESPRPAAETPRATPANASSTAGAGTSRRELEARAIQNVLGRYRNAFNSLDASAALAVWPTVNERNLARAFERLEDQDVSFESCDIEIASVFAKAACSGSARYIPKVGSRTPKEEARRWTFSLRKAGDGWLIDRVDAR